MRIQIASKTLAVTKALREFAQKQATKLSKLHQPVSKVQIFLDQQAKGAKRDRNALVKYVVRLPGQTVVVRRAAHDMYEAIILATDRALRHVRKSKEKHNGHTGRARQLGRVATH